MEAKLISLFHLENIFVQLPGFCMFRQKIMKMGNHWDIRYATTEYIYGTEPNFYFKNFIDRHEPGKILLPCEGEGRNAVYAALRGWQVDAFDTSTEGRRKALKHAAEKGVEINYFLHDVFDTNGFEADYDAVALIFAHLHSSNRRRVHRYFSDLIKDGGFIVLNAFAKEQLPLNTGGPKDIEMLYHLEEIREDFNTLHILELVQKKIQLDEGNLHSGWSENILFLAQKSDVI